jgi:hypothetical protein
VTLIIDSKRIRSEQPWAWLLRHSSKPNVAKILFGALVSISTFSIGAWLTADWPDLVIMASLFLALATGQWLGKALLDRRLSPEAKGSSVTAYFIAWLAIGISVMVAFSVAVQGSAFGIYTLIGMLSTLVGGGACFWVSAIANLLSWICIITSACLPVIAFTFGHFAGIKHNWSMEYYIALISFTLQIASIFCGMAGIVGGDGPNRSAVITRSAIGILFGIVAAFIYFGGCVGANLGR